MQRVSEPSERVWPYTAGLKNYPDCQQENNPCLKERAKAADGEGSGQRGI